MSSPERRGGVVRALLAAGTATYDYADFAALDMIPEALQAVVDTLRGLGFAAIAEPPGYRVDLPAASLRAAVRQAATAAPVVVVYYTGHGAYPERDDYFLVSKDSNPGSLGETAVTARDLLRLLTRRDTRGGLTADQPDVLVILDCCFSGSAGAELLGEALRDIGNPNVWVISSAGSLEYAQQGLFARALCDALRRPTTGPSQRFVSLDSIVQAVNDAHAGGDQQRARLFAITRTGFTGVPPFFPNPHYRPGLAGLTVADQHWLSRVRGGPEETTIGFYVTGKTGRRAGRGTSRQLDDRSAHRGPGRGHRQPRRR